MGTPFEILRDGYTKIWGFSYSHLLCSESGFCQAINDTLTKTWKLFFLAHVVIVGVFNEIDVENLF